MKIAYVALHLENKYISGGVGRKIRQCVRIWNEMGHDARLFLLTPDEIDLPDITGFRFGQTAQNIPLHGVRREISRSKTLSDMIHHIAGFHPDIIYLRYGMFTVPLQQLFKIAPVVVEVNTDDLYEYRHKGFFRYHLNRILRDQILGRASGIVAISRELAERPSFKKYGKSLFALANGIDLSNIEPLPTPVNPKPRLAFVGNPGSSWTGVDKLFQFARQAPDVQLDLVGFTKDDFPDETFPDNVVFHGFVSTDQVREILSGVDVACGSLGLHRNNMYEGSSLKVREALAYGIPIVLGNQDMDVSSGNFDFILQIPNTEENVVENINEIREFIYCMVGKRVDREAITPLIDQRIKEEKRLAFFEKIAEKG